MFRVTNQAWIDAPIHNFCNGQIQFARLKGGTGYMRILGFGGYVTPSITAWGLGRGLLVGILIGVLGGLYPAWRITRMTPLRGLARAL